MEAARPKSKTCAQGLTQLERLGWLVFRVEPASHGGLRCTVTLAYSNLDVTGERVESEEEEAIVLSVHFTALLFILWE